MAGWGRCGEERSLRGESLFLIGPGRLAFLRARWSARSIHRGLGRLTLCGSVQTEGYCLGLVLRGGYGSSQILPWYKNDVKFSGQQTGEEKSLVSGKQSLLCDQEIRLF